MSILSENTVLSESEQKIQVQKREYESNVSLIALAQSDDEDRAMEATERLIEINKGLVRSIAQRFRERGVEFEDLMQIGTVGMLKAIRNFDLSMGTAFLILFSTFSCSRLGVWLKVSKALLGKLAG